MSHERPRPDESTDDRPERDRTHGTAGSADGLSDRVDAVSRRRFLRTAAGAGAATALGVGITGSAAADGIPTPWLHRDGNLIRDPSDNKVILRGVNVPDARRMNVKDFRPDADETIERATSADEGWYSRIVRLPIQPTDVGDHDPGGIPPVPGFSQSQLERYVENHLRPAVDTCAEQNVYCIVDYHRHRGQDDEHAYTSEGIDEELTMFWETVAPEFADESHVLFEVYNEPIHPYQGHYEPNVDVAPNDDEAIETWNTWREAAQPWVDTIREHAPRNLVLIGSPRWSQWTYQAPRNEFDGDNLAYTGHVYGHQNLRPLSEYFGTPAEEVPVFVTEFGWGEHGADYITGTADDEGQEFLDFFADYDVHWQVWCFDSKWRPAMLDHDWSVKEYGEFWREELAAHRDEDVPAGEVDTDTDSDTATATPTGTSTATPPPTATPAPTDTPTPSGPTSTATPTDEPETPTDTPASDALVVNDYDGDPAWSSHRNDLGQWCGAESFENGSGEVEDGALVLAYDNGGWYQEQINRDVSDYDTLVLTVAGADGGEGSEIRFSMGGASGLLADVTDDSIGTSLSPVVVDMASAGVDRSVGDLSLRLNFWQGGTGTLRVGGVRLE
ncbi:glycoside hydrolase family 5 protein [Halosimplex halophilum]|uniref:glycoside hydrolase family 5 protein n=1 Tax=Halosimplex halophilum TaxID=2559572 RepID=UPI00107F7CAE|nr:cellulase family glycosylhydrolase [Halosimplex halophilum]